MSETKPNDGGPAFPTLDVKTVGSMTTCNSEVRGMESESTAIVKGMSVRTWLVGLALAGLCAKNGTEVFAGDAIEIADATIKELGL